MSEHIALEGLEDCIKHLETIEHNMKTLKENAVYLGVHADNNPPVEGEGITTAQLAAIHEFGVYTQAGEERIPSRPFLRATLGLVKAPFEKLMHEEAGKFAQSKNAAKVALEKAALYSQGVCQSQVFGNTEYLKPNALSTIKAKGSSAPLIDQGDLRKYTIALVKPNELEAINDD